MGYNGDTAGADPGGGLGGCNPLFFRRSKGNSTENERSHTLNYQLSRQPGYFLVNLGTSAQIGRVVPSSALAACPHLERATIISARSSCRGLRRRGSARLASSQRAT